MKQQPFSNQIVGSAFLNLHKNTLFQFFDAQNSFTR